MRTATPQPHPLELWGYDMDIKPGQYIQPDQWYISQPLIEGDDFSPLRLLTGSGQNGGPIKSLAVRVDITGRTLQTHQGGRAVRVRITFLGDGEPDTHSGGWLFVRHR